MLAALRHGAWVVFGCFACSSRGSEGDLTNPQPDPQVVVGVPSGPDELDFSPLQAGDQVQLETFFQGGTHASLAIRCIGLGKSAFVSVTIENTRTGAQVMAATPTTNPRPLICRDETTCDLLPFVVMLSGITKPNEEINGLMVTARADVENQAGDRASGQQTIELRTDDLDLLDGLGGAAGARSR